MLHQGTVQCGAPSSAPISLQAISLLHENSSGFDSSQCDPSADGLQHSGYVVQLGLIPTGGHLCLYHQEGEERHLQLVRQYSVTSTGDWPP